MNNSQEDICSVFGKQTAQIAEPMYLSMYVTARIDKKGRVTVPRKRKTRRGTQPTRGYIRFPSVGACIKEMTRKSWSPVLAAETYIVFLRITQKSADFPKTHFVPISSENGKAGESDAEQEGPVYFGSGRSEESR